MGHQDVKEYYSNITVNQGGQMETRICSCASDKMPPHIRRIAKNIPAEITARFYGCGSPLPEVLEGCTVLDLGCGTGRDVYIAAALVGKEGKVIGVDMNDDQLTIDKEKVFREIWRVLKPGGELFFSDIFADRRVPDHINNHPVLVGECLGGCCC